MVKAAALKPAPDPPVRPTRAAVAKSAAQLQSADPETQRAAAAWFRGVLRLPDEVKTSCVEDIVRLTPRFVELLGSPAQPVVTEAASVIANIAASPGESSAKVIESGAVPLLIELLRSTSNNDLKDHAALALGNVAIGSAQARDLILESGGLEPLTDVMTDFVGGSSTSARVLNSTVWAISQMRASPGSATASCRPARLWGRACDLGWGRRSCCHCRRPSSCP